MKVLRARLKEVSLAVAPVTAMVVLLNFTFTPLSPVLLIRFLIGAALIVAGLAAFLFGVDIGLNPIGNSIGSALAKSNKLWIVIISALALGFFISAAEPDLHILAGEVDSVTSGLISQFKLVVVVSAGIAVLLCVGFIRILYNIPLHIILSVSYFIIFILSLFTTREFLAISFDASGATTGALTVPFMLALAVGVTRLKKDSKASEKDSFGLVGIVSAGAVMSVMIMSIASGGGSLTGIMPAHEASASVIAPFLSSLPVAAGNVLLALLPIVLIFAVLKRIVFGLSKKAILRVFFGLLFTYAGLVVFLTGVNAGFMDVGGKIGFLLASMDKKSILVIMAFILGFATILSEPAVHVLTRQIEDVTSGYVKKKAVLITLSTGIGAAMALSMLRIMIPEIQLWHYLLPGYAIAVAMSFFVPKLFVGIAFDSGGVASGPMTATFMLAFAHGAADATKGADVLVDGFGMIALVALTPLIALQIMGLIYKIKTVKGGIGGVRRH